MRYLYMAYKGIGSSRGVMRPCRFFASGVGHLLQSSFRGPSLFLDLWSGCTYKASWPANNVVGLF